MSPSLSEMKLNLLLHLKDDSMIKPKSIFLCYVLASVLSMTYGCSEESSSDTKSPFDTFASGPLMKDQPCNLEELSCKYQPQVLEKQQELAEILANIDTAHPDHAPVFIRHIPINREDLEEADHSCAGNLCEAEVLVSTPIAHLDIPLGLKSKVIVTYSRAMADDKVAMSQLEVKGQTTAFNIGKFISVQAGATLTLKSEGEQITTDNLEYDVKLNAAVTAKLPYISFKVAIDKNGITLSNGMGPNFKSDFISLGVPVFSGSRRIPYSEIKNDFVNSEFDSAKDAYWDQFADRLAVMDGY